MKRTTRLPAVAVALPLALLLSACSDADGKNADAPVSPAASGSPAREVSPAEQLARVVVTDKDVKGFSVRPPEKKFAFAESPDDVTVDAPACAPLAYAMNQLPLGEPQASLTRYVSAGANETATYITLTSYPSGKARPALTGLSKAVGSCADGFTAKATGGSTSTYSSVAAEQPTVAGGDEVVAFNATFSFRGVEHTVHTQVVRRADVLAVYFAADGMAIAYARPSDATLPPAVVKAQNARLG